MADIDGTGNEEAISADVEMGGDEVVVEVTAGESTVVGDNDTEALPFQDDSSEETTPRTTYIDYLKSPIIGLLVGSGEEQALLTAHQALLVTSPWFADACSKFSESVNVGEFVRFELADLLRNDGLISWTKISTR